MPYELLKRLCVAQLPEKIADQLEIEKLQVLQTARLVEADMPYARLERGHHCYSGDAIVMRVTPLGRATSAAR